MPVAGDRRLLLLAGERETSQRRVLEWLACRPADRADLLWVAGQAPDGIRATLPQDLPGQLGREVALLVFDAHGGFAVDAFAAAIGMLRGGGDCVLLVPPLDAWPALTDPDSARFAAYPRGPESMRGLFVGRLVRLWRDARGVQVMDCATAEAARFAPPAAGRFALTTEQQQALRRVERVAFGHARRPLVLTADRGRGKSTLLGVAAARLLARGVSRITVVAARRAAVETLFAHALREAGLPPGVVRDYPLAGGRLCFRLPAECAAPGAEDPGLLLVDEAAAIPVALLGRLLERSNRLVFASTVHGYEGSGRGFALRFAALLDHRMPQWRAQRLEHPVRWSPADPLEALVNRSLLLDVDLPDTGVPDGATEPLVRRVDAAALADDESLLRGVFGLLVNAHYQTRPSDLRQLLDNPDLSIWVASRQGAVLGVVTVLREGGFDAPMADAIAAGARRPRGHLLPQSLAVHAGIDEVLRQHTLRVQRIAVHPTMRRRGLGARMLHGVAAWGAAHGADLLGCAFGATPSLLAFWQACGFSAARAGLRMDAASGSHSLFMLRGLTPEGRRTADLAAGEFAAQLPWLLADSLRSLDSGLAVMLLRRRDCRDLTLGGRDRAALQRVAQGGRPVATADALIWKALLRHIAHGGGDAGRLAPLLAWRVQRRAAGEVCRAFGVAGRRALETDLRDLLADYLQG